jgi:hypothetical protein
MARALDALIVAAPFPGAGFRLRRLRYASARDRLGPQGLVELCGAIIRDIARLHAPVG